MRLSRPDAPRPAALVGESTALDRSPDALAVCEMAQSRDEAEGSEAGEDLQGRRRRMRHAPPGVTIRTQGGV